MFLLECVVFHYMCTWVGSSPYRNISLLGIAHPVTGPPFQVQGVYKETTLRRGHDCEEGQHVALTILL